MTPHKKPTLLDMKMAGPDHAVKTFQRAQPTDHHRATPCEQCPWLTRNTGNFPAEAFVHSAVTAYDMSSHIFACHMAGEHLHTCAGFLLRGAEHNMAVRMMAIRRVLGPVSAPCAALHPSYRAMAIANGVAPEHPALQACRDASSDHDQPDASGETKE